MEMSPELRPIIEEANRSALKERIVDKLGRPLITEGEVRPSNIVPVIAPNRSGARTVFPMVWGFNLPRSSSPMVNARVETASSKPTFKESWERRRCIIPASYYFEWEHLFNAATGKAKTGDEYMIHPKGSAVT
jgi:putative SOS response-associated peptidase YedK